MIRLQFVLGTGMASQAIAWFSSGHLSHVDAVLPSGDLLGSRSDRIVLPGGRGSVPAGVEVRPPDYELVTKRYVVEIPAEEGATHLFYSFLYRQLHKPYDATAIWAFAFNRNWMNAGAWYCSELQTVALQEAGLLHQDLFLSANKVTPVMLLTLVSDLGGARVVDNSHDTPTRG